MWVSKAHALTDLAIPQYMVPEKGFESSRHIMTLDPKPSASASFAIRAQNADNWDTRLQGVFGAQGEIRYILHSPYGEHGVPGGTRTRNASRHQHLKLVCLPNFTTGTYWRCRCDSNACAGFHRPGSLANCSLHRLGTAPYDGVPRFVC